ncbi:MAG TPA: BON domain-containing protein [Candidatus Polarisedimenticolia bacterium]|nr:BON domain-containing protein [Candidatus Polarisedimenticolia bacterium]
MRQRRILLILGVMAVLLATACATTDEGLSSNVKSRLQENEAVRDASIEVEARDGVVTLTGNVDDQGVKDEALDVARTTPGVRDVVDRIAAGRENGRGADAPDVDRTAGEAVDDAAITRRVKARLLDDPAVKGLRIDVDTRDGVVYLTGTVASEAEVQRAVELARGVEGVVDVQPNLQIKST